ncbi:MAG: hypothetical protein HW417_487 [Steroidobacteraceae bacterium]|nr:hypothetical protein [Steroidobacteraceae bacterium]MBM2853559.1 hypothetical protein [Steroidobacteraceae bacterium]
MALQRRPEHSRAAGCGSIARLDALQLTGRDRGHIVDLASPRCMLHSAVVDAFLAMREDAAGAGIDLLPLSSFRDFERQRRIWNAKYRGERPALDRRGRPADMIRLAPEKRVEMILLWSALPGASRHHWGSDIDVVDGRVVAGGYEPKLERLEFMRGGKFAALSRWLSRNMSHYGFYRPYTRAGSGVQPEPWHMSFAPVARRALPSLTVDVLGGAIKGAHVEGEAAILAQLPSIHERYVLGVNAPPRMRSRWARLSSH